MRREDTLCLAGFLGAFACAFVAINPGQAPSTAGIVVRIFAWMATVICAALVASQVRLTPRVAVGEPGWVGRGFTLYSVLYLGVANAVVYRCGDVRTPSCEAWESAIVWGLILFGAAIVFTSWHVARERFGSAVFVVGAGLYVAAQLTDIEPVILSASAKALILAGLAVSVSGLLRASGRLPSQSLLASRTLRVVLIVVVLLIILIVAIPYLLLRFGP